MAESSGPELLEKAERAIEQARYGTALIALQQARSQSDAGLTPEQLRLWQRLAGFCERTGLHTWQEKRSLPQRSPEPRALIVRAGLLLELGNDKQDLHLHGLDAGQCILELRGHTYPIECAAASDDGRWAVSGSHDKSARIWDLEQGRCQAVFGAERVPQFVAISPDGRMALCGPPLVLFDLRFGRELLRLRSGRADAVQACFSPNGKRVVAVCADGQARLWGLPTGKLLGNTELDGRLYSAGFNAGGSTLLLAGEAGLWAWQAGSPPRGPLRGPSGQRIEQLAALPDPRFMLSGGGDGLCLWDVQVGRCLRSQPGLQLRPTHGLGGQGIAAMDGRNWQLLSPVWQLEPREPAVEDPRALPLLDSFLQLLRPIGGELPADRPPNPAECKAFLTRKGRARPKATHLEQLFENLQDAGLGYLERAAVLEYLDAHALGGKAPAKDERFKTALQNASIAFKAGHYKNALRALKEARSQPGCDREARALALWEGLVQRFPHNLLRGFFPLSTLPVLGRVQSMACTPDGERMICGGSALEICVWDLASASCRAKLLGHTAAITSLVCLPDSRRAFSGDEQGGLRLWNLQAHTCLRNFKGHRGAITSVAVNATGRFGLSTSIDESARLWDLETGWCLRELEGHKGPVLAGCFDPRGRWVLTAGHDGKIRVWELASGAVRRDFPEHTKPVGCLAISPEGSHVLSGSEDASLRLWELETGRSLGGLRGHEGPVEAAFISSDGRHALTSDGVGCLVWNLSNAQCERKLPFATAGVCPREGQAFEIAEGELRRWYLDWEPVVRSSAEWDTDADVFLELFELQHTPFMHRPTPERPPTPKEIDASLTRRGPSAWEEEDLTQLLAELERAGMGWISAEAVATRMRQRSPRKSVVDRLFGFWRGKKGR